MGSLSFGLGIDIGSVSVALAVVDSEGNVVWSNYGFHKGDVASTLTDALSRMPRLPIASAATTTSNRMGLEGFSEQDGVLCAIEASRLICPDRRSLFVVGGERFSFIRFHEDGRYKDTRSNTSCAAGTGSFLDQQAHRLGLSGSEELALVSEGNTGEVPKIASRCSVFAKTDLIHAQQEGYSPAQICDGLAAGVARNVLDTVLGAAEVPTPCYMVGGVALNSRVVKHLSKQSNSGILVPDYPDVFTAIGAALLALEERKDKQIETRAFDTPDAIIDNLRGQATQRAYCHAPLDETPEDKSQASLDGDQIDVPASSVPERYLFRGSRAADNNPVETEIFVSDIQGGEHPVYLGVDVGSTSTKAVLMFRDRTPIAGFYTRTAGNPIIAAQALLEAISDVEKSRHCRFDILAAGTTGSGRKLIAAVLGADLILDEITAHSRAATEIDPKVDTIIEIGGQDAKFTTLRKGIVTFSHMNTVCAAGTGSFIEEQASKLGVGLTDIAELARSARAPRTSNRCTVFMERDINHLLTHGYEVSEILSAVLHSVVENYLHKVATPGLIGDRICFQGATARNSALVAAFRRKLAKPVLVSRYCHLAGALGVALTAREECLRPSTRFKGLDIWQEDISVRTEICELCANTCKIGVAKVSGKNVAFGFSCGRDYGALGPLSKDDKAPDAVEIRSKRYSRNNVATPAMPERDRQVTFGVPYALYLVDDAELWRRFFSELGVRVLVTGPMAGREGRRFASAEFCAPVADLHGHVEYLLRRTDYVFLPHQLRNESRPPESEEISEDTSNMCYYTQYAATVLKAAFDEDERIVSPLIGGPGGNRVIKRELARVLGPILDAEPREISDAYDRACRFDIGVRRSAIEAFTYRAARRKGVEVVLLGRPYTILSPRMNKKIPRLFSNLGVPTWIQDEIPEAELLKTDSLRPEEMDDVHWSYASLILAVARYTASTEGLYPVFVTSFRCSPDAFIIDAFREILDEAQKPYLVLQVDDLDSAVGYETRIEAGVRAFRNHHREEAGQGPWRVRSIEYGSAGRKSKTLQLVGNQEPVYRENTWESAAKAVLSPVQSLWGQIHNLREKTLLVPCWDHYVCELLVEMFRNRNVDARLLDETPELISAGMRHNSGQCIPVNVIAEECIDYMRRNSLDPAKTALWVPRAKWACNIPMYPSYLRRVLRDEGLQEIEVYRGVVTFTDIDPKAPVEAYFAYLMGGLLRRFGCMIRPYEDEPGSTDKAIEKCRELFKSAFRMRTGKDEAIQEATKLLDAVPRTLVRRPKVGVFGDLYARDNDVFNQDLIKCIEKGGGEVVTTPYSEYAKIVSSAHFKRLLMRGSIGEWTMLKTLLTIMETLERSYRSRLGAPYDEYLSVDDENLEEAVSRFGMRIEQSGESFENVLKVLHLKKSHPDIVLFVQVNPAFCCPALVTEAMSERIQELTSVPVISITYDGTSTPRNHVVYPYLKYSDLGQETVDASSEEISRVS